MLDLTWIAYGGLIYQVGGLTTTTHFDAMKPVFDQAANSFRPLSASERGAITESRIRLFAGRNGETIEALLQRTGSIWTKEEFAVANGLASTDRLHDEQLVKAAVVEAYTSKK